jgi:VWFA-related protein
MNRFLRITALAAAAAALALPLAAQTAGEAPPSDPDQPAVFGETIDVRVVNVEVVVTDKQGNRVTGLKPEDLILYVDGDEVPIDYFTEVRGGVAVAPEGGAEPVVPGVAALAPGEPVGTRYLVFIDDWFPIERDRNRVLAALADDLPNLGAEDRMAVVAFDGTRVEMLSSWTGSQSELERVFKAAQDRPAYGLQRIAGERGHEVGLGRAGYLRSRSAFGRGFDLGVDERAYARHLEDRLERAVSAAVATLRGFARPPGRKVMLLLSGGWPYSPAAYAVDDPLRPVVAYDYGAYGRLWDPLTDTANLLGYTLYPVDVPGLAGSFGADVERGGAPLVGAPDAPLGQSFERERVIHDTLYVLAAETGGRPLINAGRRDALPEVAADTRSYYWIGFTPDRQGDNAAHRIRVEAIGVGLEVRAREGFRDLSREVEQDMAVESALLFGEAPTGGGLAIALGDPVPDGRRFIELPVTLAIPIDAVALLPEGGALVGRFELRVAALDERERRSDVPTVPVVLRFEEPPPAGGAVSYETRLRLRNQPQDLVVALHDPVSGANLMTRVEVTPAAR